MKIKNIIEEHENDIQDAYMGELFAEYVALDIVDDILKNNPKEEKKLFKLVTKNLGNLGRETLKEYLNLVYSNDFCFDFETNDEGENLIYDLKKEYGVVK